MTPAGTARDQRNLTHSAFGTQTWPTFRDTRRTSHCRPRPTIRNPSSRPALRHDGRPAGLPGSKNAVIAWAKSRSIEFDDDGLGGLGFIVVTGELDCRDADRDGRPGVEFSWQGSDEGDDVSGRGWAALNPDGTLQGHIYFHLGDDSAFRAERFNGVVQ